MRRGALELALSLLLGAGTVYAQEIPRTPSPAGARVYLIDPEDGATVSSPVTVRFGLTGMGVAPAGAAHPDSGHHHLIVDAPEPDLSKPLPADTKHVHFGKGQTETTIALEPGRHTLQLVFADHVHVPHNPPVVSKRITIDVK